MKIIKKKSNHTYKGKDGEMHNYYNYYLITDNGKTIQIKCAYRADYNRLDMIAEFVHE